MSNELVKQALLSLLPEGSAWSLKDNGDWDKTMDGQAENWEYIRARFDELSEIRNPRTTPLLSDLEREYGIIADPSLTDATRRARLAAIVYAPIGVGSASYLQARLREAGFNVYVHSNDPAVDPIPFLDQLSGAQLGEPGFELGEDFSLLGSYSSDIIVAGEISRNEFTFTATCGNPQITCGAVEATCGAADFSIDPIEYPDPTDADRWRYVFFIGGKAIRDVIRDGDMELTDTSMWRTFAGGIIAKSTSSPFEGTRKLTVTNPALVGSGHNTYAYQYIPPQISTQTLTLTGQAQQLVLLNAPRIFQSTSPDGSGGTLIWNGSTGVGSAWQAFSESVDLADGRYIFFGNANGNASAQSGWDDIEFILDDTVAGDTGAIQTIASADIDWTRRDEFLRTVLKWKPMHTWGIALIDWT